MSPRRKAPPQGLDSRQEEILRSIIRAHIVSGDPVGSQKVSQGTRIDLSPASIRNVMIELEERGLLVQPHTSAGRVPTAQAYRMYVDRWIRKQPVSAEAAEQIDRALLDRSGEIADMLSEASRQLSRFSHQVGVVLAPQLARIVVERLEFVRLNARRVVAILVGRSGVVHNRILDLDEVPAQWELDRISRHLSDELGGRTLPAMRALLEQRLSEERAAYDRELARGLELGRRTLSDPGDDAEVFVDGAANLLDAPEFHDPERLKSMVRMLEEKRTLIDLLGRVLGGEGVQVVIGDESPESGVEPFSLVAASYQAGGRVLGTLGIVGPTRMEYARAIALVDHLGRVLSRYLSRTGN